MVYTFEQYNNLNQETISFIEEKISTQEFIEYLDSKIINESILGDLKSLVSNVKEKIQNVFYTFLVKAYELGFQMFDKINTFIKWLIDKTSKFKNKYPLLYKLIIITVITFTILIVTAASASAQNAGQQIPVAKIDMAIGWLDYIKEKGSSDSMQLNKAIAHLIDLRDGKIDIKSLGEEAIKIADVALNTAQKIMDEAKVKDDNSFYKFCVDLIEKGQTYVQAIHTKTDNTENLRLLRK